MTLDLTSSNAKLDRAKTHIDALRGEVMETNGSDVETIALGRKYEPETQTIVYRIERLPEVRDSWGLLVGDAVHNMRCALDHLWWQLAIEHLGREPTKQEAKDIQFPIISDPRFRNDPTLWERHRFMRHVDPAQAARFHPVQPYNRRQDDELHPLEALADLSNTDKHRFLHPTVCVFTRAAFQAPGPGDYRDCEPAGEQLQVEHRVSQHPKLGNPVLTAHVTPTGPDPDVEFHPEMAGFITIHDDWAMLDVLEGIHGQVASIIDTFHKRPRPAEPS
jgi:hypothetical protein